jgi:hypothetical protein
MFNHIFRQCCIHSYDGPKSMKEGRKYFGHFFSFVVISNQFKFPLRQVAEFLPQ